MNLKAVLPTTAYILRVRPSLSGALDCFSGKQSADEASIQRRTMSSKPQTSWNLKTKKIETGKVWKVSQLSWMKLVSDVSGSLALSPGLVLDCCEALTHKAEFGFHVELRGGRGHAV